MDYASIVRYQLQGFSLDEALIQTLKDELGVAPAPAPAAPQEAIEASPDLAPSPATIQAPAASYAPVVSSPEEWRVLEGHEEIQEGDQWKLKDGLRHRDGRLPAWAPVSASIGDLVEDHAKSIFRRKVVA